MKKIILNTFVLIGLLSQSAIADLKVGVLTYLQYLRRYTLEKEYIPKSEIKVVFDDLREKFKNQESMVLSKEEELSILKLLNDELTDFKFVSSFDSKLLEGWFALPISKRYPEIMSKYVKLYFESLGGEFVLKNKDYNSFENLHDLSRRMHDVITGDGIDYDGYYFRGTNLFNKISAIINTQPDLKLTPYEEAIINRIISKELSSDYPTASFLMDEWVKLGISKQYPKFVKAYKQNLLKYFYSFNFYDYSAFTKHKFNTLAFKLSRLAFNTQDKSLMKELLECFKNTNRDLKSEWITQKVIIYLEKKLERPKSLAFRIQELEKYIYKIPWTMIGNPEIEDLISLYVQDRNIKALRNLTLYVDKIYMEGNYTSQEKRSLVGSFVEYSYSQLISLMANEDKKKFLNEIVFKFEVNSRLLGRSVIELIEIASMTNDINLVNGLDKLLKSKIGDSDVNQSWLNERINRLSIISEHLSNSFVNSLLIKNNSRKGNNCIIFYK